MLGKMLLASMTVTLLLCLPVGCQQGAGETRLDQPSEKVEIVKQWWPNGKLRLRKEVFHNPDGTSVEHGTYTCWYDNGQKEYEATFIRGQIHDVETTWHRNGQKRTEQHYDHGLRHGPRYAWDENGAKRKEEHYADDKPCGTWTVWNGGGKIKVQHSFENAATER